MNKRVSLTLDEHFADFVAGQVAVGRYGSPSDAGLFNAAGEPELSPRCNIGCQK